jgi:hypothetical protein
MAKNSGNQLTTELICKVSPLNKRLLQTLEVRFLSKLSYKIKYKEICVE